MLEETALTTLLLNGLGIIFSGVGNFINLAKFTAADINILLVIFLLYCLAPPKIPGKARTLFI